MKAFEWRIAAKGYRWQMWRDRPQDPWPPFTRPEGLFLVPIHWQEFRVIHPLETDSALFRNFADTPPTPEGIVGFANVYGHLGEGEGYEGMGGVYHSEIRTKRQRDLYDVVQRIPQDLEAWRGAIVAIRVCVKIWDELRVGRASKKAKKALFDTINLNLFSGRFKPRIWWDRPANQALFAVVPQSLLGAMWLQFAEAVAGNAQMRKCLGCEKWVQVSPDTFRKNRLTCSDTCRARIYRNRIDEAGRLKDRGKSDEAIALKLGTDVSTVVGWLRKLQNRKR